MSTNFYKSTARKKWPVKLKKRKKTKRSFKRSAACHSPFVLRARIEFQCQHCQRFFKMAASGGRFWKFSLTFAEILNSFENNCVLTKMSMPDVHNCLYVSSLYKTVLLPFSFFKRFHIIASSLWVNKYLEIFSSSPRKMNVSERSTRSLHGEMDS